MKKVLMFLMLAAMLAGCKNKPCSTIEPFVDTLATTFATALTCTNPEAMKIDFMAFAESKGLCKADAVRGPIASIACPIVVGYVMGFGAGKLPAAWGCTGQAAAAALTVACNALPF